MARRAAARAHGPSQRQLRVGELVREALSEALVRGNVHDPVLVEANITITEVKVSADLRNATAFVVPLHGRREEALLVALARAAPHLRAEVNRRVRLKYSPALHFELDHSFDEAERIDALLRAAARHDEAAGE